MKRNQSEIACMRACECVRTLRSTDLGAIQMQSVYCLFVCGFLNMCVHLTFHKLDCSFWPEWIVHTHTNLKTKTQKKTAIKNWTKLLKIRRKKTCFFIDLQRSIFMTSGKFMTKPRNYHIHKRRKFDLNKQVQTINSFPPVLMVIRFDYIEMIRWRIAQKRCHNKIRQIHIK